MSGVITNLHGVGIATVAASGNARQSRALAEPACVPTAVSVGASTSGDTVPGFSNTAWFLSLLAPGVDIISSVPGGGFTEDTGTSMAAPHVAGAFAVLRQAVPGAGVDRILQALKDTGRSVRDQRSGITTPRIRINAAREALLRPSAVIATNGTAFGAGQMVSVTLTAANPGGTPLDLYVGALWPNEDTVAFLAGPNVVGGLGSASSPAHISPMLTLAPGLSTNAMPVLSYTFAAGGIPAGTYHVFALLFPQGSKENPIVGHAVAVTYLSLTGGRGAPRPWAGLSFGGGSLPSYRRKLWMSERGDVPFWGS